VLVAAGWRLGADPGDCAARPRLTVTVGPAALTRRTREPDEFGLCLPPHLMGSPRLAYLSYTLLEGHHQRAGMLTLHAAAVVLSSDVDVLILGDKSSGKTTTLHALAERGGMPAGDDVIALRCIDDSLQVLPSKRVATVRGPARHSVLRDQSQVQLDMRCPFLERPAPITHIFRVNVHPGSTALLLQAHGLSVGERLRLHENLGRYLSGVHYERSEAGIHSIPHHQAAHR
jgi:hypothetical protein